MNIRTDALEGAALDWAVAKTLEPGAYWTSEEHLKTFKPSTDWAAAGPLIEKADINISRVARDATTESGKEVRTLDGWSASTTEASYWRTPKRSSGATPLVAAMRVVVKMKLGERVDLPFHLAKAQHLLAQAGSTAG